MMVEMPMRISQSPSGPSSVCQSDGTNLNGMPPSISGVRSKRVSAPPNLGVSRTFQRDENPIAPSKTRTQSMMAGVPMNHSSGIQEILQSSGKNPPTSGDPVIQFWTYFQPLKSSYKT